MLPSGHRSKAKEKEAAPTRWGGTLKTAGAISAVISFLLLLNQGTGVIQGLRVHHGEFREAIQAGEHAEKRQDYHAAFDNFKHALDLDPLDHEAQDRETEAAMLWLENAHATQEHSFTDTTNLLLPVLDKGLDRARGTASADILAHIGWANFLRYREGMREGVTIDENFRQALEKDPNNVYAHAMWGFWILFQRGDPDSAYRHFSAALASGRNREYVRNLQLGALLYRYNDETDKVLLRLANEMRKSGETVTDQQRFDMLQCTIIYRIDRRDRLVAILSTLPAEEAQTTFDWLVTRMNPWFGQKDLFSLFINANLLEMAGDHEKALNIYRNLQEDPRIRGTIVLYAAANDVKRLSAGKPK